MSGCVTFHAASLAEVRQYAKHLRAIELKAERKAIDAAIELVFKQAGEEAVKHSDNEPLWLPVDSALADLIEKLEKLREELK